MKRFYDSMTRFKNIDSKNFSHCFKQVVDNEQDILLEYRTRLEDSKLCIIQFYEGGKGYTIFEQQ